LIIFIYGFFIYLHTLFLSHYKFHRMNYFSFLLTIGKSKFILVNKYIMQKSNKNMI
jgi:hypothetical protein